MRRNRFLLFFIVITFLSAYSHAQLWSGILSPSRAVNWSQAGAGPIPNRTTICATLNPGATTSQINTAIANCAAGGVVLLNAGTYSGLGMISMKSNVTLRGAGPDATFLNFTSGGGCNGLGAFVCVNNGDNDYPNGGIQNRATWTAGYAKGSTSLTLGAVTTGSISNLRVGSILIIDQNQDWNTDPGDLFITDSPSYDQGGGSTGCGDTTNDGHHRIQTQTVQVTSISGSGPWTIGITPGIYAPNWRTAKSPGAFWANHLPITGVGIENISLNYSGGPTEDGGIFFADTTYSWVKNVRAVNGTVNKHVRLWQSHHNTIRDSYFYGGTGQSENYGVDDGFLASDDLIENNIFEHMASATIIECSEGTVFGYNFAVDNFFNKGDAAWQQQDADKHGAGELYELWEGHIGSGFDADLYWGSGGMLTLFRSRISGRDPAITAGTAKTEQTIAVTDSAWNRYLNVVGNVLGTAGYHTNYSAEAATASTAGNSTVGDLSVFAVGWSGNEGTKASAPNDILTAPSLMRWGNWDTVTNAARYCTAASTPIAACTKDERAASAPVYPGLSSPSQTLPASFYLNAEPAWWGSVPWPPIGPDVVGGNIANVGGHAYLTPAANCYLNVMGGLTNGSSRALTFNADNCYSTSATLPAPPTNLTVVIN